jgi:glycosyltransferase involved in cell wall biosynthesis
MTSPQPIVHDMPPIAPQPTVKGLVSVIIPNYNHADYLPAAIDSILNQDYADYEIIVVDDGSKDHSQAVGKRYEGQIQYIYQDNQGLSAARNTGLNAARGEFIALLDADDMYEPNFMSHLLAALKSNPDADGIICGYQFVDDQNQTLPQWESRDIAATDLYRILLDGNFLVPESIIVRRKCYEAVGGFDVSLRACEDWDMWLRISKQFDIMSDREILTRHRTLVGSMSSDPERMLNNRIIVLERHFGPMSANGQDEDFAKKRAFARAYLTSAAEYLQNHETNIAFDCMKQVGLILPDMLMEVDTWYELGLGDQPKGWRGQFSSINLDWSTQVLQALVARMFADSELQTHIKANERKIAATLSRSLALLHYGARQLKNARKFASQSFTNDPSLLLNRQLLLLFIKTFLPAKKR